MDLIQKYEADAIKARGANIPSFRAGDSLRVHVKVREGERERIQIFEGICIAKRNRDLNSSFTVRKISYGEGVERVFPLYSPRIDKIEVIRQGRVRRAKLYYLRGLSGRKSRIEERKEDRKIASSEQSQEQSHNAAETQGATHDADTEKENAV